MIQPALRGDEFLADVRAAAEDRDHLHLWWLGQSGFLLHWMGHYILLDPYLSDSLTEKYAGTDMPHMRMTERVIEPGRLNFLTAVSSSHNHTDHLDGATLRPLMRVNPELSIVVAQANVEFAAKRLQVEPDRLTPAAVGRAVMTGPFTLHAVPAAHEELRRDHAGFYECVGYIVEVGGWRIYHSGDTVRFGGMVDWLRPWRPDVALLPINGADPARGVAGNLSGPEAAELAKDIGARLVIPCHYEMFEFNTASPQGFVETAERLGQAYQLLEAGARWSSRTLSTRKG